MAVVSSIEQDLNGQRDYNISAMEGLVAQRTFMIECDTAGMNEKDVLSEAQTASPNPVPLPFEVFPGNVYGLCHAYNVQRWTKDTKHWRIVANYKTVFSQSEIDRNEQENPTARPAVITGVSRTIMVPVRSMLRTAAYKNFSAGASFTMRTAANSAGDLLDPPVEMPSTEWELHCSKNVDSLPGWFLNPAYQNGVNDADQLITIRGTSYTMPAGYAKLSNLQFSERKQENNVDFITISWNVTFRNPRQPFSGETDVPGPWDIERLDAGMRTRKKVGVSGSATTVWQNVLDYTKSQAVTTPVPFDGSGQPIKDDGSGIPETSLYKFCYRPCGPRVDYSVIAWT